MMKTLSLVAATVLVLAATGPAGAQSPYRQDVPATLEAPPPPDTGAAIAGFGKAYVAAKKPRVVVFWNKAFTDDLSTSYETQARITNRVDSQSSADAVAARGRRAAVAGVSGSASLDQTIEATVKTERTDDNLRPSSLGESVEWRMLSAFQQPFIDVGVALVDRSTIMRTSKQGLAAGEMPNIQAVEASALAQKADLIVEVLMSRDSEAPSGYSYRIEAKEVATGRIVTSFTSTATLPPSSKRYYANERGFVAGPAPVEDVGGQLALELMNRLTSVWGTKG